jgi:hypothetical protein
VVAVGLMLIVTGSCPPAAGSGGLFANPTQADNIPANTITKINLICEDLFSVSIT